MQLIDTREIEKIAAALEAKARQLRCDAADVPPLGATYTAMAMATDEMVAHLRHVLQKHSLNFEQPVQHGTVPQREGAV